jgi:hypothetical protein
LDAASVQAIAAWIRAGAAWNGIKAEAKPKWWAFQPPVKQAPPAPGNPVDAFLRLKLAEQGLAYNPRADHRVLIRRLSFALIGLPPSPADYAMTYEEAVDHYLASPRYGERWARHWLDVVRYGETDGGEHNHERFTAWPYRDWVIDSLNADKPYDQFVREQIAGDVMAPEDPKMVAATGFLVAGPWDSVSAVINRDETLKLQARMDELDDMVTTTAHSFLALTVNCARCHDHKFDPIPARDYYRMTALFGGVGFGEREVGSEENRIKRDEYLKPLRVQMDAVKRDLAEIEDPVRARLLAAKYREFDRLREGDPRRIPLNPIFNRNRFTEVKARHFRFVIASQTGRRARLERLELLPAGHVISDWTAADTATPEKPQTIVVDFAKPMLVSELRFASDARRGGRDGAITVYRLEASDDGAAWREIASQLDHVGLKELDLPKVSEAELAATLTAEGRDRRTALLSQQKQIQFEMDRAPEVAKLYAAKPRELMKSYVLEKGNVKRPGEEVSPGVLSAVGGEPAIDAADPGARRLALANWIANRGNPLTARVIVNRVWYYHFGAGLVNTPSDFGFNGDRPSHPELLDWLAVSFMEHGWSLKWLHRQIALTEAYRQSSAIQQKAFALDAGNRLLWRMPLRRMDAETMRDSILFASGHLNLKMGGPSFQLQRKAAHDYIYRAVEDDGPDVWRRAVYRFLVRGGERIMMDAFDCPDPSVATPQRGLSNTPVQALALMNNAFVIRQAGLLAERIEKEAGGAPVRKAYELLFGREPTAKELERDAAFVAKHSLAALCRVLVNSNEFVYTP